MLWKFYYITCLTMVIYFSLVMRLELPKEEIIYYIYTVNIVKGARKKTCILRGKFRDGGEGGLTPGRQMHFFFKLKKGTFEMNNCIKIVFSKSKTVHSMAVSFRYLFHAIFYFGVCWFHKQIYMSICEEKNLHKIANSYEGGGS